MQALADGDALPGPAAADDDAEGAEQPEDGRSS